MNCNRLFQKVKAICVLCVFACLVFTGCKNDSILPELMLKEEILYLTINEEVNWLDYVTALDNADGNISEKIKVKSNNVDIATPGVYSVVYQVKDSSRNSSTIELPVYILSEAEAMTIDVVEVLKNQLYAPDSLQIHSVIWATMGSIEGDSTAEAAVQLGTSATNPCKYRMKIDCSASNKMGGTVRNLYYVHIEEDGTISYLSCDVPVTMTGDTFEEIYWGAFHYNENEVDIDVDKLQLMIDNM